MFIIFENENGEMLPFDLYTFHYPFKHIGRDDARNINKIKEKE